MPDGFALDDVAFELSGEGGGAAYVQIVVTGGLSSVVADWSREALAALLPCWEATKRAGLER